VRPAILLSEDRRLGVADSVNPNLVNSIIHQDGRWQGELLPEKMYLGSGPISGRTTYNGRHARLSLLRRRRYVPTQAAWPKITIAKTNVPQARTFPWAALKLTES